jgi:hypothetical protein
MARVQGKVFGLARAGKSFTEKKTGEAEAAYGDRGLSSSQIYRMIKQAKAGKNIEDQCHLNPKKTVRTAKLIGAAAVANDRQIDTRSLAAAHGPSLEFLKKIWAW